MAPVALDAAATAVAEASGYLAEWRAQQTTQQRSYVAAGHECVGRIDAALRALHDARAALLSEIRHDEIERSIRVDQMLARLRAERYERENPVTNGPLPDGVEGRPLGRHAINNGGGG